MLEATFRGVDLQSGKRHVWPLGQSSPKLMGEQNSVLERLAPQMQLKRGGSGNGDPFEGIQGCTNCTRVLTGVRILGSSYYMPRQGVTHTHTFMCIVAHCVYTEAGNGV